MKSITSIMLLLLLFSHISHAEIVAKGTSRFVIGTPLRPDSADIERLHKKYFWRAVAETVGFNVGLWSFDRYVQKGQFAYISLNSVMDNFKHGFEWDNDYLGTNMFAHPYSGSLYFNAGRSNGFNFWQSELFAVCGSAMWELFMEREYPSTNDIIATPVGGAAIGEVLYRTSDLIIDDRATGSERVGREIAGFLVSPMRGINRLLTGRAWQHQSTSGRAFGIPPISVRLSTGMRMLTLHDNEEASKAGGAAIIDIEYGDRFTESSSTPYDYFTFLMELNAIKTQPMLSRVEIIGRLMSHRIVDNGRLHMSVGLYQHFDYFDSDTIKHKEMDNPLVPCLVPYKLGTPASVGGGTMLRYSPTGHWSIDAYAHFNGVALAGILTDFYRDYHRNYNWGSGFSFKVGVNWNLADNRINFSIADQFYKLYTWNSYDAKYDWTLSPGGTSVDIQGDRSHASFNHLEAKVNYRIWRKLSLTAGIDFYKRITRYSKIKLIDKRSIVNPLIESSQIGFHLMLSWQI